MQVDGEQFILGEPFRITPPRGGDAREESLFLTEWSSGMSYRVIPLRVSGAHVQKLDAIPTDSSDFAVLDVDGDGYPEICVWQHPNLGEHLPVARAPSDLVVYKWSGKTFVPKRRLRQVDVTKWLGRRKQCESECEGEEFLLVPSGRVDVV